MTIHEEWLKNLKIFPGNMTLPPPTLSELGLEYTEIEPGLKMSAKVPFQKRFTNPLGFYQGGMLSACMTLALNVTFLGAFKEEMGFCTIEAVVLKKTKNFIFMRADVKSPAGELIAHSEAHVKVV